MKKQTLFIIFISILLVSITPIIIPDIPTNLSQNTYRYEFGFPFHFIEQEVDIIVSHGTLETKDLSDILYNPIKVIPDKFLVINYFLSVLSIGILIYVLFMIYNKIKEN